MFGSDVSFNRHPGTRTAFRFSPTTSAYRSNTSPLACCGPGFMAFLISTIAVLVGCDARNNDLAVVLVVDSVSSGERLQGGRVSLVALDSVDSPSMPNQSSVVFGGSHPISSTGCAEVTVPARPDLSTLGSEFIGLLFSAHWIARIESDSCTETIVIETPGAAGASPTIPCFEGRGNCFSVKACPKFGAFPLLEDSICGDENL
jgi:hypothetical protein